MWTLKRCGVQTLFENQAYVDFTKLNSPVEKGMRLPLVPFLSNNGMTRSLLRSGQLVGLDVVLGKHLLICCICPVSVASHYFDSVVEAYSDLSRDQFEMVLVATPDCEQAAFDSFFSNLPYLAIPFSDFDTRSHICSFIGLTYPIFSRGISAILVDPDEMVLQCRSSLPLFIAFGSDWFPFRYSDVDALDNRDSLLRFRLDPIERKFYKGIPEPALLDPLIEEPLSLSQDILLCDPSLALPRIGSPNESLTVLELSKKHVGLYLCFQQDFLWTLINVYKECLEKKLELEILVVYIPLRDPTYSQLETLVQKLMDNNVTSWLLFPKHNKVWRRLWRIFSVAYYEDRMIILPPNGRPGELEGRGVVEQLEITEYPFTRSSILERRFATLRSVTPAKLFKGTTKNRTCLVRKGKTFNLRQSCLQGKKLLVYLGWLQFSCDLQLKSDQAKLCRRLMELYPEIKSRGWEVVFVPLDFERSHPDVRFDDMLWPIMPLSKARKASVNDLFRFEGDQDYGNRVVAFGEDGKIVSREAKKFLMEHGLDESLFNDNLYEELFDDMTQLRG